METKTIRHLTHAVDAIRAARAATKCGTVDDYCGAALERMRDALRAAVMMEAGHE